MLKYVRLGKLCDAESETPVATLNALNANLLGESPA